LFSASLTGITSYNHLLNLENLDISHNAVDSLRRELYPLISPVDRVLISIFLLELESLRHLRELRADKNKITSLDGLERMDGLVKLSLEGNKIQTVDLERYRW